MTSYESWYCTGCADCCGGCCVAIPAAGADVVARSVVGGYVVLVVLQFIGPLVFDCAGVTIDCIIVFGRVAAA